MTHDLSQDYAALDALLERAFKALDTAAKAKLADVAELQKLLSKMRSTATAARDQLGALSAAHAGHCHQLEDYERIIGLRDLVALHNKILDRHEKEMVPPGSGETHLGGFANCPNPICRAAADAGFDPRERFTMPDD